MVIFGVSLGLGFLFRQSASLCSLNFKLNLFGFERFKVLENIPQRKFGTPDSDILF